MKNNVERIVFEIIDKKNHGHYVLYAREYRVEFKGIWVFLGIDEPQIGDAIEIPISIVDEFCNFKERKRLKARILGVSTMVLNHYLLTFEPPNDSSTTPDTFNIENDYVYLIYKKTNKKILLQRAYG